MKKCIRLFISLVLLSTLFMINPVSIKALENVVTDVGFKKCLNEKYFNRSNLNLAISSTDMNELVKKSQEINCNDYNINNISGVEYAVGIKILYLSNNQLSDLAPVRNLTSLQRLYLENNKIESLQLRNLQNLINLQRLNLANNNIYTIDYLQNLRNLDTLNLSINHITDISPLANLTKLEFLGLSSNEITDVLALEKLTKLDFLLLESNHITDIRKIPDLKMVLYVNHQRIARNITVASEEESNYLKVYDIDGKMLVNEHGNFKGDNKSPKVITGNWRGSAAPGFDGYYTINVKLDKPASIISANDFEIMTGDSLTRTEFINKANLKTSYNNKPIINDVAKLDLSQVDTSKTGKYPVKISVLETSYYLASQKTVYVTVLNDDAVLDSGLKKCLNESYLNRDASAKISSRDLEYINDQQRQISCERYGIKDLTGVEYLTTISHFYFSENEITSLQPMKNLTSIYGLYMADNNISDLSPLKKLPNLTSLSMRRNKISDVSILAGLKTLKNVYFDGNSISNISMLSDIFVRGGDFNFSNQLIKQDVIFYSSEDTSLFQAYNVDNEKVVNIEAKLGDFINGKAIYTGKFYDLKGFSGKYTINAILGKPTSKISKNDFEVELGTNLKTEMFIEKSNLEVVLSNNKQVNDVKFQFDLNKVNTNKLGTYDVVVKLPETDQYFASTTTVRVTVVKLRAIISGEDFIVDIGTDLTRDWFIENSELEVMLSNGTMLDNSVAKLDLSQVDTNKAGIYEARVIVEESNTYYGSSATVEVEVIKLYSRIFANDISVWIGKELDKDYVLKAVKYKCFII